MARQYGNAVRHESRQNAPDDALTPSEAGRGVKTPSRAQIALKCLSVVPAKRIADSLDVAVRTVQKWTSGEVAVPADRIEEIQKEALDFFLDVDAIQKAVVRDLLLNQGPRQGHASRGDYV